MFLLCSCSSYRGIEQLTPQEKQVISDLESERKVCLVQQIDELDDGTTNIEYLTELISWKCSKYDEQIKDTLYEDYKIKLGEAWSYSNDLRQEAPREISQAILIKRREQGKRDKELDYLKR